MPCSKPITIKNPNLGLARIGINKYKDCESGQILIPCGKCQSCIANRQMQVIQRMQMEAQENHLFFCTLTYNNQMLPKVHTSTGFDISYASVKDIQLMIKRLRNKNAFGREFRFYAVTELGGKGGRPHAHLIFMVPKEKDDNWMTTANLEDILFQQVFREWRRKTGGTKRNPTYTQCCDYVEKWSFGKRKCTYDLHYVDPTKTKEGIADVAFYVIKYMMKPSTRETRLQQALKLNLPEEEYNEIWKLIRPRHFESENFGQLYTLNTRRHGEKKEFKQTTLKYIRDGIEQGKATMEYPVYYNPTNGKTFPLARYYKKVLTLDDMEFYFKKRKYNTKSNVIIPEHKTFEEIATEDRQLFEKQNLLDNTDFTKEL